MVAAPLKNSQPNLKQKGLLIFDSSLINKPVLRDDIEITGVPATEISSKIGNTKSANMALLGAFIAKTGLLKEKSVFEAIESSMPDRKKKSIEVNKKAIFEGMRYLEDKKG